MYQAYVCSVLLLLSTCLRDLKYFTASTITNIVTAIHKMGTKYSKNVKIPICSPPLQISYPIPQLQP